MMASEIIVNRDRLIEAKKQAALGELVPLVAHNIRNPLASIRAAAQVTLDENPEPEIQEALKDIIIAVDRLERWVTSLLTYLHPISAHFTQKPLTEVADNTLAMMDLQLKDKSIYIERKGWELQPTLVLIDINLMEQAIFNLIQNAIEASPISSVLRLEYRESSDQIELSICDQGKGMNFDPLDENAVGRDDTKRLSFGLGIPFTLKVVKQHQGELFYHANGVQGTCVIIKLPKTF
jgi:two-component system, NtrC family, sensor kinase